MTESLFTMKDKEKTEEHLIDELETIYKQVAEEKLDEIGPAFDEKLSFHESESRQQPQGKRTFLGVTILVLSALSVVLSLVLFAVFIWPTNYYYYSIKFGDKICPVKINRFTGSVKYFDGGRWYDNPMHENISYRAPLAIPSPPAAPSSSNQKIKETVRPAQETPDKSGLASPDKRELASSIPVARPVEKKPYAIQIGALRRLEGAKKFGETLKKKGLDVHWAMVDIGDDGVWHRIFIGHFADRKEAIRYMEEKKIKDSYPGSFIRRMFLPAPDNKGKRD